MGVTEFKQNFRKWADHVNKKYDLNLESFLDHKFWMRVCDPPHPSEDEALEALDKLLSAIHRRLAIGDMRDLPRYATHTWGQCINQVKLDRLSRPTTYVPPARRAAATSNLNGRTTHAPTHPLPTAAPAVQPAHASPAAPPAAPCARPTNAASAVKSCDPALLAYEEGAALARAIEASKHEMQVQQQQQQQRLQGGAQGDKDRGAVTHPPSLHSHSSPLELSSSAGSWPDMSASVHSHSGTSSPTEATREACMSAGAPLALTPVTPAASMPPTHAPPTHAPPTTTFDPMALFREAAASRCPGVSDSLIKLAAFGAGGKLKTAVDAKLAWHAAFQTFAREAAKGPLITPEMTRVEKQLVLNMHEEACLAIYEIMLQGDPTRVREYTAACTEVPGRSADGARVNELVAGYCRAMLCVAAQVLAGEARDPATLKLHTVLAAWMVDVVDDEGVQARVDAFVRARAEQVAVRTAEFF